MCIHVYFYKLYTTRKLSKTNETMKDVQIVTGKLILEEFDDNKVPSSFLMNQAKEKYSMYLMKKELPRSHICNLVIEEGDVNFLAV